MDMDTLKKLYFYIILQNFDLVKSPFGSIHLPMMRINMRNCSMMTTRVSVSTGMGMLSRSKGIWNEQTKDIMLVNVLCGWQINFFFFIIYWSYFSVSTYLQTNYKKCYSFKTPKAVVLNSIILGVTQKGRILIFGYVSTKRWRLADLK
jgi:hypothetical protein